MNTKYTAEQIAADNDRLRRSMGIGGKGQVFITQGASEVAGVIVPLIQVYNGFNAENDPYGTHDFGSVDFAGQTYYWKIDYYDETFEYGIDPYEDEVPRRVLTIMHSTER